MTVIGVFGGCIGTSFSSAPRIGEADPHRGGELRGVAGEPGVVVVVGGAGLAGGGPIELGPGAGAALDHLLEDARDACRRRPASSTFVWLVLLGVAARCRRRG